MLWRRSTILRKTESRRRDYATTRRRDPNMTERNDPATLTREQLEVMARTRGCEFSPDRLTAVLPEVRRLQALAGRLRMLPLDDLPPAMTFTPQ